jgi:hypothetical protein
MKVFPGASPFLLGSVLPAGMDWPRTAERMTVPMPLVWVLMEMVWLSAFRTTIKLSLASRFQSCPNSVSAPHIQKRKTALK